MSHTFQITKPSNRTIDNILSQVDELIKESGGNLIGNSSLGTFSVKSVTGTYKVTSDTITISITKKPFLVPTTYIEKQITLFFS